MSVRIGPETLFECFRKGCSNVPRISVRMFPHSLFECRRNTQLTEEQLRCLEKEAHGEIETEHPGYLGSQDTYFVGTMKGVGRIYQQTFIDTFCRVAFVQLYLEKTAMTAAHLLNAKVLPWYNEQEVDLLRILTDRGTEYCGRVEEHAYQLYLAVENMDHSKTKARSPQTNGICEHFHRTMKEEFYDVAFRKKIYHSVEELQKDVDVWIKQYNEARLHSGRYCYGKTPMQTFNEFKGLAQEKQLDLKMALSQNEMQIAPSTEPDKRTDYQGAKYAELQKSSYLTDNQSVV